MHEVVLGKDKKHFRFFPVNEQFRVLARFEKRFDTTGFIMKTTGSEPKKFYRYGLLHFVIGSDSVQLYVYQSDKLRYSSKYKNHLFIPFTDLTSGDKSYGGGRYIDILTDDIHDGYVAIDFNKAYNPYCCYSSGFNCPVPPRENDIPVAIEAGEKNFAGKYK